MFNWKETILKSDIVVSYQKLNSCVRLNHTLYILIMQILFKYSDFELAVFQLIKASKWRLLGWSCENNVPTSVPTILHVAVFTQQSYCAGKYDRLCVCLLIFSEPPTCINTKCKVCTYAIPPNVFFPDFFFILNDFVCDNVWNIKRFSFYVELSPWEIQT